MKRLALGYWKPSRTCTTKCHATRFNILSFRRLTWRTLVKTENGPNQIRVSYTNLSLSFIMLFLADSSHWLKNTSSHLCRPSYVPILGLHFHRATRLLALAIWALSILVQQASIVVFAALWTDQEFCPTASFLFFLPLWPFIWSCIQCIWSSKYPWGHTFYLFRRRENGTYCQP